MDLDAVHKVRWLEIYGTMFETLSEDEKSCLTGSLGGPLHGAVLLDPVFLINTMSVARASPCMEEFMLVSSIATLLHLANATNFGMCRPGKPLGHTALLRSRSSTSPYGSSYAVSHEEILILTICPQTFSRFSPTKDT